MKQKPAKLLRLPQVRERLGGIGKSTIWAWVASGRFPPPIKLGPRMSVWREEDVDNFIISIVQNEKTADKITNMRDGAYHE